MPAFVDSSSYVASCSSHFEALFGAIGMWGECIDLPLDSAPGAGPPTMANEWSTNSLIDIIFSSTHISMEAFAVEWHFAVFGCQQTIFKK